MLPQWYKYGTNCQITSAPQKGKSRLASVFMRGHTIWRNSYFLAESHGPLYQEMVAFLAYLRPAVPIILFNPSDPHLINPFNPFRFRGGSVSAHVARLTKSILQAWGIENADELPRYESVISIVLTYVAVTGKPLHIAAKLLDYGNKVMRNDAISLIPNGTVKEDLRQLQKLPFMRFMERVESTRNKLNRFVSDEGVRLFTSLPGFSIADIWDNRGILLSNLTPSDWLSEESSRLYAALLLGEIFHEARKRMGNPRPFYLYLDEAQSYLSPQAAQMFNELPKSGLRITTIHHHAGEFFGRPQVLQSIRMSSEIKIFMGGLLPEQREEAVKELWLHELNQRMKKEDKVHYVTRHLEEYFETVTETEYGDEVSKAVTTAPHLVPYVERIVDGQEDYTYQEKVSMLSERLATLGKQEGYVKLPDKVYHLDIPDDVVPLLNPDTVLQFIQDTQTNAHLLQDAQKQVAQQEGTFPERSRPDVPRIAKPKKRPARLHPQE